MADTLWQGGETLSQKYQIFDMPWYQELTACVSNNEDIEEFIRHKDQKRLEDIIQHDDTIRQNRENKEKYQTVYRHQVEELAKTKKFYAELETLDTTVKEVFKTFPAAKRHQLKKLMADYIDNGHFNETDLQKIVKPANFIDRLKNGKRYKEGSAKLQNLVTTCVNCKSLMPSDLTDGANQDFSNILSQKLETKDLKTEWTKLIQKKEEDLQRCEEEIRGCDRSSETQIKNYGDTYKENTIIRDFVAENKSRLVAPEFLSLSEIKQNGLTQEYVEGMLLNSRYPTDNYRSIRQSYDGLKEPAAPRVAYNGRANKGQEIEPVAMVQKLRERGLDAVLSTDPRATDSSCFVVSETSIFSPFLQPRDALKANIIMVDSINELGGTAGVSNPQTRDALVRAVPKQVDKATITDPKLAVYENNLQFNNEGVQSVIEKTLQTWDEKQTYFMHLEGMLTTIEKENQPLYNALLQDVKKKQETYDVRDPVQKNLMMRDVILSNKDALKPYIFSEYQKEMVNEAFANGMDPQNVTRPSAEQLARDGYPHSVFHGGQHGGKPYAVLCNEHEGNMCFVYGAVDGNNALGYCFGNSTHNRRENQVGNKRLGFLYEYEARKEKQEMHLLDMAYGYEGGHFNKERSIGSSDETAVMSHQNKLKKIYLAVRGQNDRGVYEDRLLPLETDENGIIKDKKWREFVEFYNPVDDNMSGNLVEYRNNMIADYDKNGKENMYRELTKIKDDDKSIGYTAVEQNKADKTADTKETKNKENNIGRHLLLLSGAITKKNNSPVQKTTLSHQAIQSLARGKCAG